MAGAFLGGRRRRGEGGDGHGRIISLHTIPTLVDLFVPMHRTRGRVARLPPRNQRTSPAKRVGLAASAAASPDAARVAVRHSPRLSSAAAASGQGFNLASSPRDSDDGGILWCLPPRIFFLPLLLALLLLAL